jgi:hypothetical protein
MSQANPYTFRKAFGDDAYSYAVFRNGEMLDSGLSLPEARNFCDRRNPQLEVYSVFSYKDGSQSVYTLQSKRGVTGYNNVRFGYAVGFKGYWRVYDGRYNAKKRHQKWGSPIGRAETLKEAGTLAKTYYDAQQAKKAAREAAKAGKAK